MHMTTSSLYMTICSHILCVIIQCCFEYYLCLIYMYIYVQGAKHRYLLLFSGHLTRFFGIRYAAAYVIAQADISCCLYLPGGSIWIDPLYTLKGRILHYIIVPIHNTYITTFLLFNKRTIMKSLGLPLVKYTYMHSKMFLGPVLSGIHFCGFLKTRPMQFF